MPKVVIIGAGASIDSSGGILPGAGNFLGTIRNHASLSKLLDTDEIRRAINSLIPINWDDAKALRHFDKVNIEDLFTLASLQSELDSGDRRLRALTELIRRTIDTLSSEATENDSYKEFVKDLGDGQTSLISFNWDTLLDKELSDYCPPGAPGPKEPALHWEYRRVCTAEVLNTFDGLDRPPPTKAVLAKPAYLKLHGSVDSVCCTNDHCRNYMHPFRVTDGTQDHYCSDCYEKVMPYLIPPVQNKPIRQFPHVRRAWMLAAQLLKQADEVIVWGYSLPQTDHWSRWLLSTTWSPEGQCRKLTIIDPAVARYNRQKQKKTLQRSFTDRFLPWKNLGASRISTEYYESFLLYKKGEYVAVDDINEKS